MCYLGLNFILNKMLKRYERSIEMRKHGMATHYMNDKEKITKEYMNRLNKSIIL